MECLEKERKNARIEYVVEEARRKDLKTCQGRAALGAVILQIIIGRMDSVECEEDDERSLAEIYIEGGEGGGKRQLRLVKVKILFLEPHLLDSAS